MKKMKLGLLNTKIKKGKLSPCLVHDTERFDSPMKTNAFYKRQTESLSKLPLTNAQTNSHLLQTKNYKRIIRPIFYRACDP